MSNDIIYYFDDDDLQQCSVETADTPQIVPLAGEPAEEPAEEQEEEPAEDKLKELLQSFNLEDTYAVFSECGFTYERMKYICKDDLEEIFPGRENIGIKVELREKLFKWKTNNFPEEVVSTITVDSKVNSWIESQPFTPGSSQSTRSENSTHLCDILKSSPNGISLMKAFEDKKKMDKESRKKLINLIVDYFYHARNDKYIVPRPSQIERISEEIVEAFPTESKVIYFASRKATGKSNPSGLLYNRFNNLNRKRPKLELPKTMQPTPPATSTLDDSFSTSEMLSIQNKMKVMNGNESDSRELWEKTYLHRSNNIKNTNNLATILDEWPFFKQADGPQYINHDFAMMLPLKSYNLTNKWPELQSRLQDVYKFSIKDKQYKMLFESIDDSVENDSRDAVFTMLLNAVLKPTSRFVTKIDGKRNVQKTTIKDGINSSIVHIKTINDLQLAREQKMQKSLERKTTIQPYIIVVGTELTRLSEFYICYGSSIQKFTSFISALDTCFKVYHVFNLLYPTESELMWIFFQKYVYDIETAHDIKSPIIKKLYKLKKFFI